MPATSEERPGKRLPRGRYALDPDEVGRIQRGRLALAMAEVMAEKGYAATSVQDVLKRAKVSRQTFYQLFASKLDCFTWAFGRAGELLAEHVQAALASAAAGGSASDRDRLALIERALTVYLDTLAAELAYARLFLVEAYAAGPEAIERRTRVQSVFADALADIAGVEDEAGRFTCRMIVAAISALVTPAVASGDPAVLRDLAGPVVSHIRRLWDLGAFGPEHTS